MEVALFVAQVRDGREVMFSGGTNARAAGFGAEDAERDVAFFFLVFLVLINVYIVADVFFFFFFVVEATGCGDGSAMGAEALLE